MNKDDFVFWWLQTEAATTTGSRQRKMRWDAKHSAEIWQHFDQVAHYITGEAMVTCRRCGKTTPHPGRTANGTNSMNRHFMAGTCIKAANNTVRQKTLQQSIEYMVCISLRPFNSSKLIIYSSNPGRNTSSSKPSFSEEQWKRCQVRFITKSNLPFQILAHKDLTDLISMAWLASSNPTLLTPRTARRRLRKIVQEDQHRILSDLPPNAKLSIALHRWTSPFQQAFTAITGYFLDQNWKYREILLGFEPLHGKHSGVNLGQVLFECLQEHRIIDRVLAITTDNASNNDTLVGSMQTSMQALDLPNHIPMIRIPCLAHVIQLSLKDLLAMMNLNPKNDSIDRQWSAEQDTSLKHLRKRGIIYTLAKVRRISILSSYLLEVYLLINIRSVA